MTTPNVPTKSRYNDDSMTDWAMVHKREVTWGLIALAAIVLGLWYYQRSRTLLTQRAESQYFQARQAAATGNVLLAASDLQKVADRYEGTRAGAQAALTAAQLMYDQKKYREGLAALEKAQAKAPDDFKASIHVLEAGGYEQLKDFLSAAGQYKLAATATRFPADKAQYQAAAARDYMAAGKTDEAKVIWTELAKDDAGPMAAEAKVRLGEVTAKPMTT
ncbi:MAG: tetratricopeptide repeat protein [Gemmatimonadaceae bacterium]